MCDIENQNLSVLPVNWVLRITPLSAPHLPDKESAGIDEPLDAGRRLNARRIQLAVALCCRCSYADLRRQCYP